VNPSLVVRPWSLATPLLKTAVCLTNDERRMASDEPLFPESLDTQNWKIIFQIAQTVIISSFQKPSCKISLICFGLIFQF